MDAKFEEVSGDLARLRGVVAAIGGALASMPEAAQFDQQIALRIADTILGPRASANASREARSMIDLLAQLSRGSAEAHPPKGT
jgi:hypothetical protein